MYQAQSLIKAALWQQMYKNEYNQVDIKSTDFLNFEDTPPDIVFTLPENSAENSVDVSSSISNKGSTVAANVQK